MAACRTRNRRSRASPAPRPRSSATPPTSSPRVKQVDLLKAEIAQATAALARAQAVQSQAELNLGYTTIVAPIDGMVGNRTLRIGQFVQAGTQLMSVVPVGGAYVVANFKETQLTDVREGQPVDIAVDMFPGQTVHGHVDSIAPASGQEFALLPPDNATGNFTKVVQRIPVKIALDAGDDASRRAAAGHVGDPDHRDHEPALATSPSGIGIVATRSPRSANSTRFRKDRAMSHRSISLDLRASSFAQTRARSRRSRTAPASRPGSPCWPP